jgi:hypothetical protein
MNRIGTLTAVLLLGTVFGGSAALAQTPTAPNSGAGVPGLPGNKSGPAMKPGEESNVRPDQAMFRDCLATNPGRRNIRRADCKIASKVMKRKTRIRAAFILLE